MGMTYKNGKGEKIYLFQLLNSENKEVHSCKIVWEGPGYTKE